MGHSVPAWAYLSDTNLYIRIQYGLQFQVIYHGNKKYITNILQKKNNWHKRKELKKEVCIMNNTRPKRESHEQRKWDTNAKQKESWEEKKKINRQKKAAPGIYI